MNDSHEPERFGCGMHADDRLPFLERGVRIGAFSVLGRQPYATAANRRPVRLVGAGRIGSGTVVGCHVTLYAGSFLGKDCCIGDNVVVREDTRVGDRCVLGVGVDLQYGCTLADDVRVLNQSQLAGGTVVGEGTFIAPNVQTANDARLFHFDLEDYQDRGQVAPIIGKFVKIGPGAIILPGVRIGDRATVYPGAVVNRDVAPGETVKGMPARPFVTGSGGGGLDGNCAAVAFASRLG